MQYDQTMKKSPLLSIFLVVFLDLVGFGIVIPILPYYSKAFGASAFTLGWLMASYSITQFLFAPFWGSLSDRYGRRPILLATIAGGSLAMLLTGMANSLALLFLGRLVAGAFGANISTASAYIADVTKPEDRAKGMGIIGASFGLGFIFGPAIGGILSPNGYNVPILLAAGLGALNFLITYIQLEEPKIARETRTENRRHLSWSLVKECFSLPGTGTPIALFFFGTTAFTQLEVAFGLFVLSRYGYDARHAGFLLAGMGVIGVFIQGGAIGKLAKRFGEMNLLRIGYFSLGLAMLVAGFTLNPKLFIVSLAFIALGNSLVNPSLSSLLSKAAPENRKGAFLGVYQSAGSLARIVGPPISGFFFDHLGPPSPIFCASFFMIVIAIYSALRKAL